MEFRSGRGGKRHPITPRRGRVPHGLGNRYSNRKVYPSAGIRHEGSLTDLGYNLYEDEEARESALNKAVMRFGYANTVKKVNVLNVLNKGDSELHHKTSMDLDYLRIHKSSLGDRA